MEITEENLKTERDTFALNRDYKHAVENLARVKKDTGDAIAVKDKVSAEIEERKEELQSVLNQIAAEKVSWAQHRHAELSELEGKQSEANNVIKRKGELNDQEEAIRKTLKQDEDALNENRRLEFKIEQDKTALEVERNQIKSRELDMSRREEKLLKDAADFKEKIISVLHQAENI